MINILRKLFFNKKNNHQNSNNNLKTSNKNQPNNKVILFNRDFYIDELDSLNLKKSSIFEPDETDLCKSLISKGDSCLDIGANIGYYTALFTNLVGLKGQIISFEPDLDNFNLLEKNCLSDISAGIVTIHKVALGEENTQAALYKSKDNHGMHRLYSSVCCSDISTEVQVVRGDDLLDQEIDFLKIDIEGYEFSALKGLENTILNSKNIKILSEFSPLSIKEAGFSPITLINMLLNMKLIPFELKSNSWHQLNSKELLSSLDLIENIDINLLKKDLKSKTNQEIAEAASNVLLTSGYNRPLLENLLWVKSYNLKSVLDKLNPKFI